MVGTPAFLFWSFRLSGKNAAHPLSNVSLHFARDVGVGVQHEARAAMAQNVGSCLNI